MNINISMYCVNPFLIYVLCRADGGDSAGTL